jgi:uncharacterized protein (DUF362 family)
MSMVVVVKHSGGRAPTKLTTMQYRRMLTVGLETLSGKSETGAALRRYLPRGVIGMKTNCLAQQLNSTPVNLVEALSSLLTEAGWEENDLVVWERTSRELKRAGYTLNAASSGRRCLGTDANGLGYSRELYTSGEASSLVSRILTELVAANINLPLLKDHSIAGLSGGLKNMYGAIHNPNKFHGNNCDPFCAHVSNLEPLKSKNRLSILDAGQVQYNGGPGFMERYLSKYRGIILSDDPVAGDRVGLEILQHLREKNGLPPLEEVGREVKYLTTAQNIGLGTADLTAIDLKVVTVDEQGGYGVGELFSG